ncbi:MAG: hypothetical protein AB7N65_02725 [Vicinamibacterales bacterium]
MTAYPATRMAMVVVAVCWMVTAALAQTPGNRLPLPLEPFGDANEAVYPVFEGWGATDDDSGYFILLGYKNRNRTQVVEIPIGPNNRIEPGGPDYGQPTVFQPGRQSSIFAIKVPKDFGTRKLTWTVVANGQPAVVTFYLHPEYNLNFYKEESNGNEPPRMKLAPGDAMTRGPRAGFAQTLSTRVGEPLPLRVWASDTPPTEKNWERIVSAQNRPKPRPIPRDQVAIVNGQVIGNGGPSARAPAELPPDMTVTWTKMRGPGIVAISPPRVPLVTGGSREMVREASATATFSAPGEYVLRVEPVELEDGFDGLCCVSFVNIQVIVR